MTDVAAPEPSPTIPGLGVLLLAGGLLLASGGVLGWLACDARRHTDLQQLVAVAKQALPIAAECIGTLRQVVPGALIEARNAPTVPRQLPVAVRDSARERRWTSP